VKKNSLTRFIKRKRITSLFLLVGGLCLSSLVMAQTPYLLNEPVDISPDFRNFTNTYFLADSLVSFDPATAQGTLSWQRNIYQTRQAFDNMLAVLHPTGGNEFPGVEYAVSPVLPFRLDFVSPRTVRIRMVTGKVKQPKQPELMIVGDTVSNMDAWKYSKIEGGYKYTSPYG